MNYDWRSYLDRFICNILFSVENLIYLQNLLTIFFYNLPFDKLDKFIFCYIS